MDALYEHRTAHAIALLALEVHTPVLISLIAWHSLVSTFSGSLGRFFRHIHRESYLARSMSLDKGALMSEALI